VMLHWSPRAPIKKFGTTHISAFAAFDILRAASVLRSTVARPSSGADQEALLWREQDARLSLAQS
jgi:hypothetical protein